MTNKLIYGYQMASHQRKDLVSAQGLESLYDTENEDALINIMPQRLVPIFERVKAKMPKTLMADERTIRDYCKPDIRDERVRLSFWDEYNASTGIGKRMSLQSVICGVMHWDVWTGAYEPSDTKMVWVFTPPVSYVTAMRHILHEGTERLLDIMRLPMQKADGTVDVKVANLVLRAWQLADMRMKGGVIQRVQIDQKSVNVNVETEKNVKAMGLEELESLERRIEKAKRDQTRYLKSTTDENRTLVLEAAREGDYEMLEDIENATAKHRRQLFPEVKLPTLPKIEIDEDGNVVEK